MCLKENNMSSEGFIISSEEIENNKNRIIELSGAEKKNASNRTLPAGFYVINGQKVIVK